MFGSESGRVFAMGGSTCTLDLVYPLQETRLRSSVKAANGN